jgi:acyl dehydratase
MNADVVHSLQRRVGTDSVGDWVEVTQEMIDKFAEAIQDFQFIHVNPEAARQTPFGGTIAHGFLTLSLFHVLASTAPGVLPLDSVRMILNYGGNKVRFLTPVRSGARVRGRFRILDFFEKSPGRYQQVMEYVIEIQGEERPALVAEWLVQVIL